MDPELGKARRFMQEKILNFLAQRQPQTIEIPHRRIIDLVKRLEEGLFRTATTQEEYLNLDTLESRLYVIIKRLQMSNNNPQRSQYVNSSVPLGTMIPTPRMPQHGNSNIISSTDNSVVSASIGNNISYSAGNNAYLLPTENGSSAGMHGVSTGIGYIIVVLVIFACQTSAFRSYDNTLMYDILTLFDRSILINDNCVYDIINIIN